jgi:hypothetical protein
VKLDKSDDGGFVLRLTRRERALLLSVLRLYPLLPSSYHRLSRTADPAEVAADQKLLEEAVAAQEQENRRQLQALLDQEKFFKAHREGFLLPLAAAQLDWFLQILNDIRVGSWLRLDCPDEPHGRPARVTPANARFHFAMEYCGALQTLLLRALDDHA